MRFTGTTYTPYVSGWEIGQAGGGRLVYGPDGRMWGIGSTGANASPAFVAFNTTTFAATYYAIPTASAAWDLCTDGTNIYGVSYVGGSAGYVWECTTAGTVSLVATLTTSVGSGYYAGVVTCWYSGGYIYAMGASNNSHGRIWQVSTGGGVTTISTTGSTAWMGSVGLAVLAGGNVWWGCTPNTIGANGLYTTPLSGPGAVTEYNSGPLNYPFAMAGYDGTNLWTANGAGISPVGLVSTVESTGVGTLVYGTSSSNNSQSIICDGTYLWGFVPSVGAWSSPLSSPGTITTYNTYYVSGVSTTWKGGGAAGLDGSGNLWVCNGLTTYEIATNAAPAVTTQLVMLV